MADIGSNNGNGTTGGKENSGGGKYDGPFTHFDTKFADYFSNLMKEKDSLDADKYPLIHRLVQNELSSISKGAVGADKENGHIDLYGEAPITLYVKAMPPTKIFPKVNYPGRILGPKGAYLKALKRETKTNMILLGQGVMKDKDKEDQLRRGSDPKYYHLNEDMHIAIQVTAPASEAYAKVAYALRCLKELALTDGRVAEQQIPWISNATRQQGDAPAPVQVQAPQIYGPGPGDGQIGPARQLPPPPSQQPAGGSYPPQRIPYDSPPDFRPPSIHEGRPPPEARPAYDYGHGTGGGGVRLYDQKPQEPPSAGRSPSQAPYFPGPGPSSAEPRRPAPQLDRSNAMSYIDKVLNFSHRSSREGTGSAPGARAVYDYGHSTGGGGSPYDQKPPQAERIERSPSQSQRYAPY